jgi:hypothetical protein
MILLLPVANFMLFAGFYRILFILKYEGEANRHLQDCEFERAIGDKGHYLTAFVFVGWKINKIFKTV